MKKVTSYLVAVFALMSIVALNNADAAPNKEKTIAGTIQSVDINDLGGGKLQAVVKILKDGETVTLLMCNSACKPDFPNSCIACATCFDPCLTKLQDHVGSVASFMYLHGNGNEKFIQGQMTDASDPLACPPTIIPGYEEWGPLSIKCFSI